MGTLGSQVMCDNIPGLVSRQRQLCRQHPMVMQAIGAGMTDWISECQHQFRNHRWNCNTTARDHSLLGRLLLRSEWRKHECHVLLLVLVVALRSVDGKKVNLQQFSGGTDRFMGPTG